MTNNSGPDGDIPITTRLGLLLIPPLSGLAQSGLTPILPKLSEHFADLANADVLVRLMVSALSFAMIAGALLGGVAGDRFGQRRVLIWTLAIFAIAGTAGFFLDNIYLMIASRMVLGLANAAAGIMVAALFTTRIGPGTREKWLGFTMVAGTFGGIAVFAIVGAVAKLDWRYVFLLHAAALPVALLIMATLPPAQPAGRTSARITAPLPSPLTGSAGGIPIGMMALGIACGAPAMGYIIFLPYQLNSIGYGEPEMVAGAIMMTAFAGAVVSFGFGWIRAYLDAVQVFMLGFAVLASGLAIVSWVTDYQHALVGLALLGGGVGLIGPNLFSASAAAAPPQRRARSIGFARAGMYGGPLVAQLPLEPLVRSAGASAAMMVLAGFAVLMIGVVALLRRFLTPIAAGSEGGKSH